MFDHLKKKTSKASKSKANTAEMPRTIAFLGKLVEAKIRLTYSALANAAEELGEGVRVERRDRLGLEVRRQADLDRDAVVADEVEELVALVAVVEEARPVAEAVSAEVGDGLLDRLGPERLAGVDGDVEEVVDDLVEGVGVVLGREVHLRPGQVEADDASDAGLLRLDRQAGRLERGV